MTITLLFFARARDLAGTDRSTVVLDEGARVADLRARLVEQFPALKSLAGQLLVAVSAEYATDETLIPAGAEVAVFPPVSGG